MNAYDEKANPLHQRDKTSNGSLWNLKILYFRVDSESDFVSEAASSKKNPFDSEESRFEHVEFHK